MNKNVFGFHKWLQSYESNLVDKVVILKQVKNMNKKALNEKEAWAIQENYKGKPHGWIQWKGTEVCMDVHCKCGALNHIDAHAAYYVKCSNCGTVYMCNGHIELIELEQEPENCVIETE